MPQNNQFKELPHYRVTLEDAIAHYKRGDLTAKGALRFWIRIRLAEGWELNFSPKEVCELFGMGRSTFWTVLKQLKQEGEVDYQNILAPRANLTGRLTRSSLSGLLK